MPKAITVLHISDMQFGKYHRFAEKSGDLPNTRDNLATRLIDDLKRLENQNQLRPDLIICTGDLAEWGMAKEFADAFAFLGQLCQHYSLPRSRCIVIPGNHDINRSSCEAYFMECKADGEAPVFPWFPKWKHYKAAFDKFYAGFPGITFDSGTPWSLFVHEDLNVVVAGLNSTMDEGHEAAVNADDRKDKGHHGLCTEPQLDWFKKRLSDPQFEGWLRIGAVHHNAIRGCRQDDENLRDADTLGGMLKDHLHLLLHGHTHEAKSDLLAKKVWVYSTGSASLKTSSETAPVPTDIPNQYQFLAIQQRAIARYCRQYAPRNTPPEFIADVRQSPSKDKWIIKDKVDLSSVKYFIEEPKPKTSRKKSDVAPQPPVSAIPKPPALYAEPDYIGSHRFVGRETELRDLSDWANRSDPTNLLLFEAIGGNGKSMLTWEWTTKHATNARLAKDPWAGRFWYSFYERGAIMEDFCQRALAYMTGRPLAEFKKRKTAEMRDELFALLHARPWLLILDGLERVLVAYHRIDAAEVPDEEANAPTDKILNRNPCDAIRDEDSDLLRALAACASSKVLVSSRLTPRVLVNPSGQPIPGARRITLPGLRPPDAEALLRQCGITGESAAIQDYLRQNCDNHPLVIGILAGLIANYLPDRDNFDSWSSDPSGGAALDLSKLDLIQRRNHILHAAIAALSNGSRQLLSTLALLSESVDSKTLEAFNPHLPPEPEEVHKLEPPEKDWDWDDDLCENEKAERRTQYEAALARRKEYEKALGAWRAAAEVREAPKKLAETVRDLEQRGLLQYDGREHRYDLHPVVRGVAAGGMKAEDKERYGQRVVDHFSAQPHNPYETAQTLEDLSSGLHIVRTLLKLGHYQKVVDVWRGGLSNALLFNLEAYTESLSLVRSIFPARWDELPNDVRKSDAAYLANFAALALEGCGESEVAISAYGAAVRVGLETGDWREVQTFLSNISNSLYNLQLLSKAFRMTALCLDLATVRDDEGRLFWSRVFLFFRQAHHGNWQAAEAMWRLLDPMGRDWSRNLYRQGEAEKAFAYCRFWQGTLHEELLTTAATLAEKDNNRLTIRRLHCLRGCWRLEQRDYPQAVASFHESVRMARERRLVDAESETGLALAKFHLGQLTGDDARSEAERLAQRRQFSPRYLAMLWLAIGDPDHAKHYALDAYHCAWADGEPYVDRYELTKTTELLQEMNVPIPRLPPYDPSKDKPFPWEADVRAAIEKLRAEKEEKERKAVKKPD